MYVCIVLTFLYVLSPFDLLPEVLLGPIGYIDDFGVLMALFLSLHAYAVQSQRADLLELERGVQQRR